MSAPPAPVDPALQSHLDKWLQRWPEWAVAEVFVPPAQRAPALAWATLQLELTDAAWGGADARPGEAKLGWWQDELDGWAAGRRRHPLGLALLRQSAPWSALAAALPALGASRDRARDADAAMAVIAPFASAAAGVDASLFGRPSPADGVALGLLHARLAHHADGAVPEALVLDEDGGRAAWRDVLRARFDAASYPGGVRGIWTRLARARLRRGDALQPLPPLAALWAGWRGARG